MQVELLVVHGANPCTLDNLGHTPEECARYNNISVCVCILNFQAFNVSCIYIRVAAHMKGMQGTR